MVGAAREAPVAATVFTNVLLFMVLLLCVFLILRSPSEADRPYPTSPQAVTLSGAKSPRAQHSTTQSALVVSNRASTDVDRLRREIMRKLRMTTLGKLG